MKDFMMMLLTYSAALSMVILFYIAIIPLLSKHYSATGLYYTWLVIVIGLLIPFRPRIDTAVIRTNTATRVILSNEILNISKRPVYTVTQTNSAAPGKTFPGIEWWQLMTAVWIAGIIIFLLYHGLKHYRFVKTVNRWSEKIKDEKILAIMKNIINELAISGQIGLYLCPYIGSPMMIGLFKPGILLPTQNYSEDEIHFILKHELIHYKRKDLWYKCLMLLATAIHWFNPVIYLMSKAINIQCELSCDAEVISGTDANTRQRYCETLIGILKNQSSLKTALSTNFYGGKKGMKNRISLILDTNKKKIGLIVFCIALITTIGAGIASIAANSENASASKMNSDVIIRIADQHNVRENFGTSVSNIDSRPHLEFYIEGKDIAKIDISCENEYLYAVDWTKTQHEKYWNVDYYQTFDEETQTSTFYADRLYDKSMSFTFSEDFSEYPDIWYRWKAYNLYKWASENNYSRFLGYGAGPKIEISDQMTEEQKLMLAAGDDGSRVTGLGHIQLDGYPEELTRDRITIKITDRNGNTIAKYINVEISNNEFNETVVTASLEN
ncbi:MAG: M56 family metallopeptidase [Clostridiaceae bacterium]|nr:M56 family metallopeptidase [Clostridiaceae bacterium]